MKSIKIACLGDSNTYGFKIFKRNKFSYPALLQKKLNYEYKVINFGANGNCVQRGANKPYLRNKRYQKIKLYQPDIIFLMLGSNDAKKINYKTSEIFIKEYNYLITNLKKLNPKPRIILMSCVKSEKRTFFKKNHDYNRNTKIIAEEISKYAHKNKLEFIDTYIESLQYDNIIQYDGVHLNRKGTSLVAQLCFDKISK